jgi:hypothetical protein
MQDNQIAPKIAALAPPDMARLPPSIVTKIYFSSKQPTKLVNWDYTYFELALLYKENRPFLLVHSPSV